MEGSFAFSFVEGVLVKAIREGGWVLLDEINLASAETLQRLSGLLEVSPRAVLVIFSSRKIGREGQQVVLNRRREG